MYDTFSVTTYDTLPDATGTTSFGYDAAQSSTKREQRPKRNWSEDAILNDKLRDKLTSDSRELDRNFSIAAWALRKHLDYVSTFSFQAQTDDENLNDHIEAFIRKKSKPGQVEVTGRHSLASYIRTLEGRAVIDGDCGTVRLRNGLLQAIEGDRIRDPKKKSKDAKWVNGVKIDEFGRPLLYCVHNRGREGKRYDKEKYFGANNFNLHGYFGRFDQTRGVTPFSSGINSLLDVYEGIGHTLAKMKVEALFALVTTRDADEGLGDYGPVAPGESGESDPPDKSGSTVDFGFGPVHLDMDPGEDAKFLKSDSPGANSREFMFSVLMLALKSLDLPFSFFDEAHTNFFGSRAAWLHYERSCDPKRDAIRDGVLEWWTLWKMTLGLLSGELRLPRGMKITPDLFEWVPRGMPWWDPVKEVNGDILSIGAGLNNPQAACKARGTVFEDNIRATSRAMKYAEKHGVPLSFVPLVESTPSDEKDS